MVACVLRYFLAILIHVEVWKHVRVVKKHHFHLLVVLLVSSVYYLVHGIVHWAELSGFFPKSVYGWGVRPLKGEEP